MYSAEIEVSYFAAGIAAHLSSDDTLDWSKVEMNKTTFTGELVRKPNFQTFYVKFKTFVYLG